MRGFFGSGWRTYYVEGTNSLVREMSKIQFRPFDMVNYLNNKEEMNEYLRQVFEDGDPTELAAALGDIARARGMTQLAKDT